MADLESLGTLPETTNLPPRYVRRRANDDRTKPIPKRSIVHFSDPVAAISGMLPRYKRRASDIRADAEAAAFVAAALAGKPAPTPDQPEDLASIDAATPELRRRIAEIAADAANASKQKSRSVAGLLDATRQWLHRQAHSLILSNRH
jgi:hypothetical protein